MTSTPQSSNAPKSPFGDLAAEHLRDAQAAMTDLLTGVGLDGARPTDVGRELGLDKTLAWKISRFVEDQDPAKAAKHMPGPGGMDIVLKAAASRGVPKVSLDGVRTADQRLRDFVREHAGDRRTFEAMLAGRERDEKLELEERRAFYRAGSTIWGVRAKLQFLTLILRPSEQEPDMLDVVQLGGFVALERLRPDIPWIVRRLRTTSDTGEVAQTFEREPLDAQGVTGGGLPLLPEFCSDPAPVINQFEAADGWLFDEIAPGRVGREGAVTCVTGEVYRAAVPHRWAEDNKYARYFLTVRTPVEGVLLDVLLHESLAHWSSGEASAKGLLEDRPGRASGAQLIEPTQAHPLGSPPRTQSMRLAAYPKIVSGGLNRIGWDEPAAFRGYRVEMDYPPAPCEVALRFGIQQEA